MVTCALPYSTEDLLYSLQPPYSERSNRNHRTTARVGLSCLIAFSWEKKTERFQCFPTLLLILTDTLNVATGVWMLTRCCQDFGQRPGDRVWFQRDFLSLTQSPADMDATASAK